METFDYVLIEDAEWAGMSISDKLKHYVSTPVPDEGGSDYRERNRFMDGILDCFGSYNAAVDEHIILVLEAMLEGKFFSSTIAKEQGWPEEYAELISYIVCKAGIGEYGTSPRGAWVDHKLVDLVRLAIPRWRAEWH